MRRRDTGEEAKGGVKDCTKWLSTHIKVLLSIVAKELIKQTLAEVKHNGSKVQVNPNANTATLGGMS